ncbi:MAG: four helix bundle protein [Vicinamibacterales bacterium]
MGARHFTELAVWQEATRLKREIYALVDREPFRRDRSLRSDLVRAAASIPANIAEGFGRYRPREFHRFLEIAKASASEAENHCIDAHDRGHISADELARIRRDASRVIASMVRLMRYLRSPAADTQAGITTRRRQGAPGGPGTRGTSGTEEP